MGTFANVCDILYSRDLVGLPREEKRAGAPGTLQLSEMYGSKGAREKRKEMIQRDQYEATLSLVAYLVVLAILALGGLLGSWWWHKPKYEQTHRRRFKSVMRWRNWRL